MTAHASPLRRALESSRYEEAALRLLYAFLVTLEHSAPAAREALLDELIGGGRDGVSR
jgi:hypothetical protein